MIEPKYKLRPLAPKCTHCQYFPAAQNDSRCLVCLLGVEEHYWQAMAIRLSARPRYRPRALAAWSCALPYTISSSIFKCTIIKVRELLSNGTLLPDFQRHYAKVVMATVREQTTVLKKHRDALQDIDLLNGMLFDAQKQTCGIGLHKMVSPEELDTILPVALNHRQCNVQTTKNFYIQMAEAGNLHQACHACNYAKGAQEMRGLALFRSVMVGSRTITDAGTNCRAEARKTPFVLQPFAGPEVPAGGLTENERDFLQSGFRALAIRIAVVCPHRTGTFALRWLPSSRHILAACSDCFDGILTRLGVNDFVNSNVVVSAPAWYDARPWSKDCQEVVSKKQ